MNARARAGAVVATLVLTAVAGCVAGVHRTDRIAGGGEVAAGAVSPPGRSAMPTEGGIADPASIFVVVNDLRPLDPAFVPDDLVRAPASSTGRRGTPGRRGRVPRLG